MNQKKQAKFKECHSKHLTPVLISIELETLWHVIDRIIAAIAIESR
jgi:hypothetical protein